VERLLGVPTGRVDGVVLADALTHPSAARVAAQEKRGNELRPIQLALKARAATH
jgi:hypothetical protein